MRRWLGVFALSLCGLGVVWAADSDEATKTRNERLKAKVSVDWKNKMLGDALADLVSQIDEAGLGKIEIKFNTGVSMNQRVTFAGKDKTVEEVLDGVLGTNLGYVVISKKGDKADGGLTIKTGSERGTAGEDKGPAAGKPAAKDKTKDKPKADPKEKPEPKPKPEPKEKPEPTADDKEKQASSKLDLIKMLVDSGKKEKARERLEEMIKTFDGAKAAAEAKELLEKLK